MSTHPEYVFPTVHTNGTPIGRLEDGFDAVAGALQQLHAVLEAQEFNGRDYYPQGPDAFKAATAQRAAAINGLKPLQEWVDAHRIYLCEARENCRR